MAINDAAYVDYLYKEYVALSDRINSFATSSFEDFELLAAAGAVLAWKPLVKTFSDQGDELSDEILQLIGFFVILLVVATIDARDNLKHSAVRFYMTQARLVEAEFLALVGRSEVQAFHTARNWLPWFEGRHKRLIGVFHGLVYSMLLIVPAVSLLIGCNKWLSAVYVAFFLVVISILLRSTRWLRA